jgi:hypothetical protein
VATAPAPQPSIQTDRVAAVPFLSAAPW